MGRCGPRRRSFSGRGLRRVQRRACQGGLSLPTHYAGGGRVPVPGLCRRVRRHVGRGGGGRDPWPHTRLASGGPEPGTDPFLPRRRLRAVDPGKATRLRYRGAHLGFAGRLWRTVHPRARARLCLLATCWSCWRRAVRASSPQAGEAGPGRHARPGNHECRGYRDYRGCPRHHCRCGNHSRRGVGVLGRSR